MERVETSGIPVLNEREVIDLMRAMESGERGSFLVLHLNEEEPESPVTDAQLRLRLAPAKERDCACRALAEALTPRDLRILQLSASGLTEDAIGATLGVSRATVKKSKGRIFSLLGVKNIRSAIRAVTDLGILSLE